MTDALPSNARYVVMIAPKDDEDIRVLMNEIKRALRDYPDRPIVAVIYRNESQVPVSFETNP